MKTSKYNIISKVKDSHNYLIMNALSGSADILTAAEYAFLAREYKIPLDTVASEIPETTLSQDEKASLQSTFIEKGYLVDPAVEEKQYREEYFKFLEQRDEEEIQLFFVPSYACNFKCFYCYQETYTPEHIPLTREVVDAFFHYVETEFAGKKKYITLFGGEPLLGSRQHKEMISYFLDQVKKNNIDISIVTNGFYVAEYIPLFKGVKVREIQITLDGTEEIHNIRRPLKSGNGTFATIVEGIDACLKAEIPVNLRVVVDRNNINNLVELSRFAIKKGWTENPVFKTQLGRNYELHGCQKNSKTLYDRLELHKDLYTIIKEHPEFLQFHKPSFSIAKYLTEEGVLPEPIFDDCPGTKYEWAFDYKGNIYACTATVGKSGEELGTFYPEKKKYEDAISCWEDRDITTIPECRECSAQLVCGGGCASLAKNKSGKHLSPDCRPVAGLLELGIGLYNTDI